MEHPGTILVADDNAETLAVLAGCLRDEGYTVVAVASAEEAVRAGADDRAAGPRRGALPRGPADGRADTPGLADCLEGAAAVAALRGRWAAGARLAGAATALREADDLPAEVPLRARYERHLAAARAQDDEAAWATAWAEGRAMPLDEALALAEEELGAGADDA